LKKVARPVLPERHLVHLSLTFARCMR
jgi:hypothetical protein